MLIDRDYQYDFGFFFFNDTATTEIYTLSLHDALPIYLTESGAVDLQPVAAHPRPKQEGEPPRAAAVGLPGGSGVEDLDGAHRVVLGLEADKIVWRAEPMAAHDRHAAHGLGGDPVHRGGSVRQPAGCGEQHGVDRPGAQGHGLWAAAPDVPAAGWRCGRAGAVGWRAGQPQGPRQRAGEGWWWRGGAGCWPGRHGRRCGAWTGRRGWWWLGAQVQQPPGEGQRAQRHQDRKPGLPPAPLHPAASCTRHLCRWHPPA